MRVMVTTASTSNREYYLYRELLHDLPDLESNTFREHWYYRAAMFRVRTNLWDKYNYLIKRAREYLEGNTVWER